jgi:hypothetical protein
MAYKKSLDVILVILSYGLVVATSAQLALTVPYYSNSSMTTKSTSSKKTLLPDEQILLSRLLLNYDPASRPIYNASNPVNVQFGISFTQICDMVAFYIKFNLISLVVFFFNLFFFTFQRTSAIRSSLLMSGSSL